MKLSLQQLPTHLIKTLAPIYLVGGDDIFLVTEALDTIRKAAAEKGFSERIRIAMENADWGNLFFAEAQSRSLFATKRILELDLTQTKLTASHSKIFQEYVTRIPDETVLLIRTHKLDSKSEQQAWYKALLQVGVAIAVWPITAEQFPQWLIQRAEQFKLKLTKPAVQLLAERAEGNILAAVQELEKLSLLQLSEKPIDQDVIANTVTDHAHFDLFALVDHVLAGDMKRSLAILQNLEAEDTEPTLILWALTRELRTMAEIGKQLQLGQSLPGLFAKFRIWEKRQPGARAFLKRHKTHHCWEFLKTAAGIDRIIKGVHVKKVPCDVWMNLRGFVIEMVG